MTVINDETMEPQLEAAHSLVAEAIAHFWGYSLEDAHAAIDRLQIKAHIHLLVTEESGRPLFDITFGRVVDGRITKHPWVSYPETSDPENGPSSENRQ